MLQDQQFEEVDDRFEHILRLIIQELHVREGKDEIACALLLLLVREANTWRSIRLLRQHTPDQFHTAFMVDAGTLLRAMFDAYLQAEFILRDPAERTRRAGQYVDFAHVERYKMMRKVLNHDNPLTERLKCSPDRIEGEKRLQQEFDRVKAPFLLEKQQRDGTMVRGPGTANKWYRGDLFQLATAAGKEAEYDTLVTPFGGCVHSSALAVENGPMVGANDVMFLASMVAARVARMNVLYNQVDIGDERLVLDELCKGWLDKE